MGTTSALGRGSPVVVMGLVAAVVVDYYLRHNAAEAVAESSLQVPSSCYSIFGDSTGIYNDVGLLPKPKFVCDHPSCYYYANQVFCYRLHAYEIFQDIENNVNPTEHDFVPLIAMKRPPNSAAYAKPQVVPCYFIFGDSLMDNGNNNHLPTTAKANYPPYGIDFPGGRPTGRFSNGRNMADFIAQLLGFEKYIPPFATAKGPGILMGVNYASGGAGIRDETGKQLGARISMNMQLSNHHRTLVRMALLLGSKKAAKEYASKCLYSVGMGSNDYINNYLLPQYYPTSRLYTPDQYAAVLIRQYSHQLRTLVDRYGARKVAVFGLGLLGCTPVEVATFGPSASGCVDSITIDVEFFNVRLKSLVDHLNTNLTHARFIYINTTEISSGNASAAGITVTNVPCCIVSPSLGKGQCLPNSIPCSNRSRYAFWDGFHPTEIASEILSTRAYSAETQFDAHPYDIRRLAEL